MGIDRLADVQWGIVAHATLRYTVLAGGLSLAGLYAVSTVTLVDFGLLVLFSIFVGIVLVMIASHSGPRTSSQAFSIEPGAGTMPDSSGFASAPIGDATLKMIFYAIGLFTWGAVALIVLG